VIELEQKSGVNKEYTSIAKSARSRRALTEHGSRSRPLTVKRESAQASMKYYEGNDEIEPVRAVVSNTANQPLEKKQSFDHFAETVQSPDDDGFPEGIGFRVSYSKPNFPIVSQTTEKLA
jgi:hypothetical protein